MSEIFKKNGELKARPPKKYKCGSCEHITSKPRTIKTAFAGFYVCDVCSGSLKERNEYIEWMKRKTGQWDMEILILKAIERKGEVSKEYLEMKFANYDQNTFHKSWGELVYNGVLKVNKTNGQFYYRIASE